jgi:hypothetical protein
MDTLEDFIEDTNFLNENKYFIGLMMIFVNIGSRYLIEELDDDIRGIINSTYFRRFVIFCVLFMATRDIIISIILTGLIILLLMNMKENKKEKSSNVKNDISKALDTLKIARDSL